jgi:hypothetical protein
LESGTGTATSVLLWFASARITDKKTSVILHKSLSQFVLGFFIDILGVVSDNRLGNGSSDCVDLCCDTSTLNSDTDIQGGEFLLTNDQNGLKSLQTKDFGLHKFDRLSIDLDESPALLSKGNSSSRLFPEVEMHSYNKSQ